MNIIFAIAITTARMHLVLGKVLMLPKAGFNCYGKPKTSNDLPTLHMYSVQNFFFTSWASCVAKSRRIQLSTRRVWQRPHGHGGLRVASPAWGPPQKAPRPHHAHAQCTEHGKTRRSKKGNDTQHCSSASCLATASRITTNRFLLRNLG